MLNPWAHTQTTELKGQPFDPHHSALVRRTRDRWGSESSFSDFYHINKRAAGRFNRVVQSCTLYLCSTVTIRHASRIQVHSPSPHMPGITTNIHISSDITILYKSFESSSNLSIMENHFAFSLAISSHLDLWPLCLSQSLSLIKTSIHWFAAEKIDSLKDQSSMMPGGNLRPPMSLNM